MRNTVLMAVIALIGMLTVPTVGRSAEADRQLGTGKRAAKGTASLRGIVDFLRKDAQARNKGRAQPIELYYIMTNLYIKFVDADYARVHYYWMALYTTPRLIQQQGGHERPPSGVESQPGSRVAISRLADY